MFASAEPRPDRDTARVADELSPEQLHPAEHRGYRELYACCRQLVKRWGRLTAALEGTEAAEVLKRSAGRVRDLLAELEPRTAAYGLHGGLAAQGLGTRIAELRSLLADRAVDTGMVLRFAVLDIEHIATLLAHLGELAATRGDEGLAGFCRDWAKAMRPEVKAVRRVAVGLGSDPDRAGAPLDDSTLTRAAHGAGWALGSVGEAFDRVAGGLGGRGSESASSRPEERS